MPTGGGVRGGPFHASSPEGWFIGQPGLKVVCPGTVADAYGLLRAAIDDPDPVLFLEHKALYRRLRDGGARSREPRARSARRTSRAAARRRPWSPTAPASTLALEAVERLEADVEVLDLRTVWPVDTAAVLARSPRPRGSWCCRKPPARPAPRGSILSLVAREGFELLDAPPALHAPLDTPVPFAPELEDAYLPSVDSTAAALEALLAY